MSENLGQFAPRKENRRRALEQAGVGGGLVGAGAGVEGGLNARLRNRGADTTTWSAASNVGHRLKEMKRGLPKGSLGRKKITLATHGVHTAGLLGARALQLTGLPMVGVGLHNARKGSPTKKIKVKDDVVAPVVRRATLTQGTYERKQALAKSLTRDEEISLDRRRRTSRGLSQVSGTMGLAALGLRAPAAARVVSRKVPSRALSRLATHEGKATRWSNTLGVGAIGVGSANSFNWAGQQKLERKKDPAPVVKGFVRQYRDHLSPEAEAGYKHLRSERREAQATAAGQATMAGLSGWLTHHEAVQRPRNKAALAVTGASTLAAGYAALGNARVAGRRKKSMRKIEAKAKARAQAGLYGPGRSRGPVDTSSARAKKYATGGQ